MSKISKWLILPIVAACVGVLLAGPALRARQEDGKVQAIPKEVTLPEDLKKAVSDREAEWKKFELAVAKMLDAVDLTPHSLPPIPDDPLPHEGAMINYPIVLHPPDLVLVEVLEALPGRPISGERLVRQDGTLSLGFYGDVHVAGLSVEQARVKILKLLRRTLTDEALGLVEPVTNENAAPQAPPVQPPPPAKPQPKEEPKKAVRKSGPAGRRTVRRLSRPATTAVRRTAQRVVPDEKKAEEPRKTVNVPLGPGGQVTITVEIKALLDAAGAAEAEGKEWPSGRVIPLSENNRIFVDVTAYNSTTYYILGDVAAPGILSFTGNETVLDALNHAGDLIPTSEPKDIRLVRPARGGKPARVYKVDLEAIRDRGDATTNYQIFPGDRLVVGRNEVDKKTIEIDRLARSMQTVISSIQQESLMLRSLQSTSPDQHEKILKDLVEFWVQEMKRGEAKFDENTLRDALLKRLQVKP